VAPTHTPEDDFAVAVQVRGWDGQRIVDIYAAITSSWWIATLYPSGFGA